MSDPKPVEERLLELCIDWTGEPIVDQSTPRIEITCGELREAATELTALRTQIAAMREALEPLWAGIQASPWHDIAGERMKRILVAETAIERVRAAINPSGEG